MAYVKQQFSCIARSWPYLVTHHYSWCQNSLLQLFVYNWFAGSFWSLHPASGNMFENGCYLRRQKRFKCPTKDDRRKSRSSKRNNNNNNHSDSGNESVGGLHGHVTTKKEIIDQVVSGHPAQHMGSSDLATGLIGQQNSLTDSYIQPGKINWVWFPFSC